MHTVPIEHPLSKPEIPEFKEGTKIATTFNHENRALSAYNYSKERRISITSDVFNRRNISVSGEPLRYSIYKG